MLDNFVDDKTNARDSKEFEISASSKNLSIGKTQGEPSQKAAVPKVVDKSVSDKVKAISSFDRAIGNTVIPKIPVDISSFVDNKKKSDVTELFDGQNGDINDDDDDIEDEDDGPFLSLFL